MQYPLARVLASWGRSPRVTLMSARGLWVTTRVRVTPHSLGLLAREGVEVASTTVCVLASGHGVYSSLLLAPFPEW